MYVNGQSITNTFWRRWNEESFILLRFKWNLRNVSYGNFQTFESKLRRIHWV